MFLIGIISAQNKSFNEGEKVRMNFDKDWRITINSDSMLYYRIITFKEENIPAGKIEDYHISGELKKTFYSFYAGLDSKGMDSIAEKNGPEITYYKNGNKYYQTTFFNGLQVGEVIGYYESGLVKFRAEYVDGLVQGEKIGYYETGEVSYRVNYRDNLKQGKQTGYHKSGKVEYIANYVDGLVQGEEIGYYETGQVNYRVNYRDNLKQRERIWYYETGEVSYRVNYRDNLKQGKQTGYHKSGKVESIANYVDDLIEGEYIGYYESGQKKYILNWKNSSKEGKRIDYYESGAVKKELNYIADLAQGIQIHYLENGEIEYTTLWVNDKIKERRIALVIGNADYDKGKLSNPINDANLIAESLENLDFEVLLHTNLATKDEMVDAIKNFGRKRKNYEIGFVYYAGHGIQLNNHNYLLPKEELQYEDDVEDNAVSMQKILRYLESTREGQLNFIVLDACRNNPFEQNWNKTRSLKGGGLAKIPPLEGSLIAFSTDHGQTAADGDGGNSLYSQALASKMLEEGVSIEQVFKNVRTEVLKLSNNEQSPVEESKLTGDMFYLNKKGVSEEKE